MGNKNYYVYQLPGGGGAPATIVLLKKIGSISSQSLTQNRLDSAGPVIVAD
jgi:hypothetical protein